jgi:ABC-type glycerol-3-phosphate transport system substrate-binding protein
MECRNVLAAALMAALSLGAISVLAQDGGSVLDLVSPEVAAAVTGEYIPNPDLQQEQIDMTYWSWYGDTPRALYEQFREYYPNINITFEDMGPDDVRVRTLAALQGGIGAPCMVMLGDKWFPQFADAGLLDLSPWMEPYAPLFAPGKLFQNTTADGRILGVPWDGGPVITFYRRSVFEEYGLDPTSIETWEDFLAMGQQLSELSNGEVSMLWSSTGFNIGGTQTNIAYDQNILAQQLGSGYFDNDGNVVMDNEANVRALKLVLAFREAGITRNDPASGAAEVADLQDDTVATFTMAGWWSYYPKANVPDTAGDWGLMLMPAWEEGGRRGANNGGSSIYITEQCEHPEAAFEFLRFWLLRTQGRIDSFNVGSVVETVFLPTVENEFFQQGDPFFGGDPFFQLTQESAAQAASIRESVAFSEAEAAFNAALPGVLDGSVTPEVALNNVANELRRRLGQPEQPPLEDVALFE